eukprot:scaffold306063_cov24-Tisochrysis_lutea.AAC.1
MQHPCMTINTSTGRKRAGRREHKERFFHPMCVARMRMQVHMQGVDAGAQACVQPGACVASAAMDCVQCTPVLSAAAVRAGYSRCFQQQLCDSHDHLRRTLSASKNAGAVLRAVSSSVEALMTLPWCKYIWAVPKCGSGAE